MAKNPFANLFGRKKETPPPDEAGADKATTPEADAGKVAETPAPSGPPEPGPDRSVEQASGQKSQNLPSPPPEPAAPAETPDETPVETKEKKPGLFSRLRAGLSKSSGKLTEGVTAIFNKRKLDDETLEELEDLLIGADLGVAVAGRITAALAKDKFDKTVTDGEVRAALAGEVMKTLSPLAQPLAVDPARKPHVILMTGVNGAGKTTTIGKLAEKFRREGKSVVLAAGDTFRAAAIEQLTVWGERTGAPVIAREVGADAAGLAYDALQQAKADGADVLMIDTAGRLQNRRELMDELAKIVRVLRKLDPEAPHSTLLVLDATVGQNAVSQAQAFTEIAGVNGLVMTKLDGTARGGVLVALGEKFGLPIHFIGVGESVDDLQPFDAADFAEALTGVAADKARLGETRTIA